MRLQKNIPLIVTPYSETIVGGISSWTKNMMVYAEMAELPNIFQFHCYSNNLMSVTNTKISARISTGIIVYSKLIYQVFVLIVKYKPSILHVASSATLGLIKDTILIWLGKLTKTPVVIHWHFGRIPELAVANNWEWKLLKYVVRNCNRSVVIDKKSYDTLIERGFLNVENIPNPLPIDIEERSKNELLHDAEKSFGRVLFVGHLLREKGVFELVEACIDLPENDELVLIGPCEEDVKGELIELSHKRGDGSWLKLTGQQNKDYVLQAMANSQILALPSYTEGFPNVVIEAMAMGCAVVATNVGAIPQMIDCEGDSSCGICIPTRNVEKLRTALHRLIVNPEVAKEMGTRGIRKVMKNYTLNKVAEQYLILWEDVIEKCNFGRK